MCPAPTGADQIPTKVGPPTSVFGEGTAGGLIYEV